MIFAIVYAAILAVLLVFQLALAFGAPWGRLAWSGQNPGVLPRELRIGSAVAALVYAIFALFALDFTGVVNVLPTIIAVVGMWMALAFLALSIAMNAVSRSKLERAVMTPIAAVLTLLALAIVLSSSPGVPA